MTAVANELPEVSELVDFFEAQKAPETFTVTVDVIGSWDTTVISKPVIKYVLGQILAKQSVDYGFYFTLKDVIRAQ